MFKVGDLVKRVKELKITNDDYDFVPCGDDNSDYGIVIDTEEPIKERVLYRIEAPEVFVKVLWQNVNYGPTWHWGDEIVVVERK